MAKVKVTIKARPKAAETQVSNNAAEKPASLNAAETPLRLDFSKITQEEKAFLAKFLIAFAVLYLIAIILPLAPLLEWIAGTQANWLHSAGIDAFAEGSVVHANGSQFEIVNECSSLVMIALLAALLFAGGKKSDWKALAIGVPLLFAFNLLRLFATIAIGASFGDGALDAVHYLLWIVDAGLVLAVWLAFGRKKEENKKNEKDGEQEHK